MTKERGNKVATIFIILLVLVLFALLLSGCKTKYITVPEYHENTIVRVDTLTKYDSIRTHDSIISYLNGDTFFITKYKEKEVFKFINKVRTDTLRKTDSIRVPFYIERKPTKWQQIKQDTGGIALISIGIVFLFTLIKYRKLIKRFFDK